MRRLACSCDAISRRQFFEVQPTAIEISVVRRALRAIDECDYSSVCEALHAAASAFVGREISTGHSAPSGQLSENHRIASSKRPVVMSLPSVMRERILPSLKTSVLTREIERPEASQYADAKSRSC